MRNLVRRYVTQEQRKAENEGVTEDDVNEIKNDISAFRFELIEIMRSSGMNTSSATGTGGGKYIFKIPSYLLFLPIHTDKIWIISRFFSRLFPLILDKNSCKIIPD